MQATVCKWKSNRLPLPIMKFEVHGFCLSDFNTVYFYRGSFLVQSVGKQAAGREVGRMGLLGEDTGAFPTCWDAAASGGDEAPGERSEIS